MQPEPRIVTVGSRKLGGDELREEIRRCFEEPEPARAEFRARSAVTLAERGSADWWLRRWGDHYPWEFDLVPSPG